MISERGMTPNKPYPLGKMGKREREATPFPFARFLIDLVNPAAVLWAAMPSVYDGMGLEVYNIMRDARTYSGPGPVICHPPCGPWGKYHWNCGQSRDDGLLAIEFVHRYGGVVEQPEGSQLFIRHARPGGVIKWVNQFDYGHRALKPTQLYIVSANDPATAANGNESAVS
jgi:hypothetical protein